MIKTLDLKKQFKSLYSPPANRVVVAQVPDLQFLQLDGIIGQDETPGTSPAYQEVIGALYSVAYTLKFASKQRRPNPVDYPVMALEGLWWVEGGEFDLQKKQDWNYTMMIMVPDHIDVEMFEAARVKAGEKKPNPALARVRLERFEEGLCVQALHIGPYATEPATLERMSVFARENGYAFTGKHHEIYLGDPRRAKPEKLKTILRHPVKKV